MKKFTDSKHIIMAKESVSVVTGTDHMLALGGGVRAKIGKTREGKVVIQEFLFDKNRFSDEQAERWISENQEHIDKSVAQVQENAPRGSFADIAARVSVALNNSEVLPKDSDGHRPWFIQWIFPDFLIVDLNGSFFRVDYSQNDRGEFTFEEPKEVEMEFVTKESEAMLDKLDKRYSNLESLSEYEPLDVKLTEKETEKKQILAVLIEAGTNHSKKRFYPEATLREAAGLFSGLKMYIDHPTEKEDIEKPERSIREWVATIVESWYDKGRVMGRVQIHSDWLWESLSEDEVFRNHIGISINAFKRRSFKKIDGEMMEVIDEIVSPRSVDWVTEPGARGRVHALIESAREKTEKESREMDLKTLTLKEVQTHRPDLVEAIRNEGDAQEASRKKDEENNRLREENKKLKEDAEARQNAEQKSAFNSKVKELVEASKLPAASKEVLIERHTDGEFKDEAELTTVVENSIKTEFEYLKKLGGVKINSSERVTESENVAEGLESRLGLKEKDDKKD